MLMFLRVASFVRIVLRETRSGVAILYERGNPRNDRCNWPEMSDPAFRDAVLKKLQGRVKNPHFAPPDSYDDDWTFGAYSKGDAE